MFVAVYEKCFNNKEVKIDQILFDYQRAFSEIYLNSSSLSKMIKCAGDTLRENKRILYLSSQQIIGALSMIDASEW